MAYKGAVLHFAHESPSILLSSPTSSLPSETDDCRLSWPEEGSTHSVGYILGCRWSGLAAALRWVLLSDATIHPRAETQLVPRGGGGMSCYMSRPSWCGASWLRNAGGTIITLSKPDTGRETFLFRKLKGCLPTLNIGLKRCRSKEKTFPPAGGQLEICDLSGEILSGNDKFTIPRQ